MKELFIWVFLQFLSKFYEKKNYFSKKYPLDYSNYSLDNSNRTHILMNLYLGVMKFSHNCALEYWKNTVFWNICYEILAAFFYAWWNTLNSSNISVFSWQFPLLFTVRMLWRSCIMTQSTYWTTVDNITLLYAFGNVPAKFQSQTWELLGLWCTLECFFSSNITIIY